MGKELYILKRTTLSLMVIALVAHDIAYGQKVHEYTIDAGIGTHSITTDDGNRTNILDIEGNSTEAFVQGEYFLTRHDAVTGGLFYREKDYVKTIADKNNKFYYSEAGLKLGIRHFLLPHKWIVQPFVGVNTYVNFLNLNRSKGTKTISGNGESHDFNLKYDCQSSFLSIGPQVGVDVYIFKDIALGLEYDYSWGLNGSNHLWKNDRESYDKNRGQNIFLNLKVRLPYREMSDKGRNNLYQLIESLFEIGVRNKYDK
jgi:hypothetical protein